MDRRIDGVPTLVLANKQDSQDAVPIEEIKEIFNRHVAKMNVSEGAVLPISALKGFAVYDRDCKVLGLIICSNRTGVRESVDWLFLRVQNSRRR